MNLMRYSAGLTDKLPEWAGPLTVRRLLWQEYGIAFSDASLEDVFNILRLETAEAARMKRKGTG